MKHHEFTIGGTRFDILSDGKRAICIVDRDPRNFVELTMDDLIEALIDAIIEKEQA